MSVSTNPGVVDEHVEPSVPLAVACDHLPHALLRGHVRHDVLHGEPPGAQPLGGVLERVRPARGDRQQVALLAERLGQRVPDPT
jgi:hypothetical protein